MKVFWEQCPIYSIFLEAVIRAAWLVEMLTMRFSALPSLSFTDLGIPPIRIMEVTQMRWCEQTSRVVEEKSDQSFQGLFQKS